MQTIKIQQNNEWLKLDDLTSIDFVIGGRYEIQNSSYLPYELRFCIKDDIANVDDGFVLDKNKSLIYDCKDGEFLFIKSMTRYPTYITIIDKNIIKTTLSLNTLYSFPINPNEANIWFNSGYVNIHTSSSATQPTAISQMTVGETDGNLIANTYKIMPSVRYMAITQASGTTTDIVLSGIEVKSLGSIS